MGTFVPSPNISVVLTCYREGPLLQEAVESVLQQTQLPQEIIIVNDASPDPATNEVCRELENHPLITLVWREQNGGPSVARNHGYQIAQGEILIPLDSDDLLPPHAVQTISQTFQEHPDISFVYGNYTRQDYADDEPRLVNPGDISLSKILRARSLSISTNWQLRESPIRKSLWMLLGGYDLTYDARDLNDLEFMIRVITSQTSYAYIPETIYIWRKYLGGNTQQVTPMAWYRIAKKYFDIYQSVGLKYRAVELILLGAKWQNNYQEIRDYSRRLIECILSGEFQLSSLIILITPAWFIQWILKKRLIKR